MRETSENTHNISTGKTEMFRSFYDRRRSTVGNRLLLKLLHTHSDKKPAVFIIIIFFFLFFFTQREYVEDVNMFLE